jgi:hypothetical protein
MSRDWLRLEPNTERWARYPGGDWVLAVSPLGSGVLWCASSLRDRLCESGTAEDAETGKRIVDEVYARALAGEL